MKKLIVTLSILAILSSCKTTDDNTEPMGPEGRRGGQGRERGGQEGGERGKRPNPEELIAKMDANKDGKLSKEEIKGPLGEKFNEVDTNNDGFITLEELKKAPKPENQRPGQGGPGRRQ